MQPAAVVGLPRPAVGVGAGDEVRTMVWMVGVAGEACSVWLYFSTRA